MTFLRRATPAILLASGVALLAGCATSPLPLAKNFELTEQKKVRSAGHWDLLSRDVVQQTMAALDKSGAPAGSALFVALPERASSFDIAFRDFLITKLVQSGRTVTQEQGQSLRVTYQTQVVRHHSPRPNFEPGRFTMLTAGLFALYGLRTEHRDVKLLGGLGLAGATDYWASVDAGGPTHTELVLTTTIAHGGRFLTRKTDVYYVESDDTPLFARALQERSFRVVSE